MNAKYLRGRLGEIMGDVEMLMYKKVKKGPVNVNVNGTEYVVKFKTDEMMTRRIYITKDGIEKPANNIPIEEALMVLDTMEEMDLEM